MEQKRANNSYTGLSDIEVRFCEMETYLNTIIDYILAAVTGGALTAVAQWFRKSRAQDKLLLCLARDRLNTIYDESIRNGHITVDTIEISEPMFVAYKANGGDGIIDAKHAEVAKLPVKEDDVL